MELVKLLQLIAQSWLLHVPSTGIFAAPGACTALLPFVATQLLLRTPSTVMFAVTCACDTATC
jgi:hypothetical protein